MSLYWFHITSTWLNRVNVKSGFLAQPLLLQVTCGVKCGRCHLRPNRGLNFLRPSQLVLRLTLLAPTTLLQLPVVPSLLSPPLLWLSHHPPYDAKLTALVSKYHVNITYIFSKSLKGILAHLNYTITSHHVLGESRFQTRRQIRRTSSTDAVGSLAVCTSIRFCRDFESVIRFDRPCLQPCIVL